VWVLTRAHIFAHNTEYERNAGTFNAIRLWIAAQCTGCRTVTSLVFVGRSLEPAELLGFLENPLPITRSRNSINSGNRPLPPQRNHRFFFLFSSLDFELSVDILLSFFFFC
jgi:hypothetical protein